MSARALRLAAGLALAAAGGFLAMLALIAAYANANANDTHGGE